MRFVKIIIPIIVIGVIIMAYFKNRSGMPIVQNHLPTIFNTPTITPTPTIIINTPPSTKIISQQAQVFQSFNNCGPASLSMLLSYFNMNVSQEVIGQQLRPYQNFQGDNDDKSVTVPELEDFAKSQNLMTYYRPNGNVEMAKKLIANDVPFIVRTWLNPNEDIGHYRVVRGYDDITQEFIQDDSYQGGNLRYSYVDFMAMWQPFNYEYLVIIPTGKEEIVKQIIGENVSETKAWEQALTIAKQEEMENPQNPYPIFNQSVAYYHLGKFDESVQTYEKIVSQLPNRMLWYQIEPIKSYLEVENYETVFNLTDTILNNQNRGFSELYILRGKAYEKQGNVEMARQEYQQAIFYNQNLKEAQELLANLPQ